MAKRRKPGLLTDQERRAFIALIWEHNLVDDPKAEYLDWEAAHNKVSRLLAEVRMIQKKRLATR